MKAWRFHGFNDLRLDDVPEPRCGPGHVLVEPLCVQPSVTEAQLAYGIPTLAFDRIKRRLETEAPGPVSRMRAQNSWPKSWMGASVSNRRLMRSKASVGMP